MCTKDESSILEENERLLKMNNKLKNELLGYKLFAAITIIVMIYNILHK